MLAAVLLAAVLVGWTACLLPLSGLLLGIAGLTGTLAAARHREASAEAAPGGVGRAARMPQAALVPPFALAALACACAAARAPLAPSPMSAGWVLAGAAALAFALLLAERHVQALSPADLPEAPALARLLAVPAATVALWGLLLAARSAGLPWTTSITAVAAAAIAAIGAELALRASAGWFLPPPAAAEARAAVASSLLHLARRGPGEAVAAPLLEHVGLDFSRSWALGYARAAFWPVLLVLLAGAWLLSGLVVLPPDGRAVAERFGAPVGVLGPGLHAILPWPFGRAIVVEYGTVHEATLTGAPPSPAPASAEAAAAAGADRLWDQAHPAELLFLVARDHAERQDFLVVSADIRVIWRVGMRDADALRLVTTTCEPQTLVEAAAARATGTALAGSTLDSVIGEHRETLAETLRASAQRELDDLGSGIEIVAIVIEAMHPPPGAAAAYHAVQAAEIRASTTIATESGRAQAARAMAQQQAEHLLSTAQAGAAESDAEATIQETRFTADRAASSAGGRAFLLERYYEALVAALAGSPKTILDRSLGGGEANVIDLRPLLPAAAAAARDD